MAPDLTGNPRTGLGAWSLDGITEYLHTGRNARAGAGGPMAEVITYSTSLMTDADRQAIATYLKSLPASANETSSSPDAVVMKRGAAIYSDACTGCHLENGVGQPKLFPPLGSCGQILQYSAVTTCCLARAMFDQHKRRRGRTPIPDHAVQLDFHSLATMRHRLHARNYTLAGASYFMSAEPALFMTTGWLSHECHQPHRT